MEAGLFVTFFEPGEAFERELPPVGPLVHLVAREHQLVGERSAVHQAPDMNIAIDRWLEAELELQRALGEEPGGTKRSGLRVSARDGVFVRFAVFGDEHEQDIAPEVGPFAVVVVGTRSVEADGRVLATRGSSEPATWELTSAAGARSAGVHRPDIAFRARGGAFHPAVATVAASVATAAVVAPAAAPATPTEEPPALAPADLALIERMEREREEEQLRAPMQDQAHGPGADAEDPAIAWAMRYRDRVAAAEDSARAAPRTGHRIDRGALLWRMRFAILGLLVVAIGAYGFLSFRSGGAVSLSSSGGQSFETVGIAQKVSSARWEYVVNGVQRVQTAGASRPNGTYYVIRLGVTSRATDGAQLSPAQFTLIDANGTEHRAENVSSDAYYGPNNTSSQYVWPATFAVGKTASISVIFDVSVALGRGNRLAVDDLPRTRFALD